MVAASGLRGGCGHNDSLVEGGKIPPGELVKTLLQNRRSIVGIIDVEKIRDKLRPERVEKIRVNLFATVERITKFRAFLLRCHFASKLRREFQDIRIIDGAPDIGLYAIKHVMKRRRAGMRRTLREIENNLPWMPVFPVRASGIVRG